MWSHGYLSFRHQLKCTFSFRVAFCDYPFSRRFIMFSALKPLWFFFLLCSIYQILQYRFTVILICLTQSLSILIWRVIAWISKLVLPLTSFVTLDNILCILVSLSIHWKWKYCSTLSHFESKEKYIHLKIFYMFNIFNIL